MKLRCQNNVGAGREIQALLPEGFKSDSTSYGLASEQWITVWCESWRQFPTSEWETLQDEIMQVIIDKIADKKNP